MKNLLKLGNILDSIEQKQVKGGNACSNCYNNCLITTSNRIEFGICIDLCQQNVC